jgi:soluble lytic murein transglycosylase-like protein
MKVITIITLCGMITLTALVTASKVHPISVQSEKKNPLQAAALRSGLPALTDRVLDGIVVAAKQTGLSEPFILSLIFTESSMKPNAVSSKHYKGLMQIPHSVFYEDANILIGARIFLDKLRISKGDYRQAIVRYKGWHVGDPEGYRQADKVLELAVVVRKNL